MLTKHINAILISVCVLLWFIAACISIIGILPNYIYNSYYLPAQCICVGQQISCTPICEISVRLQFNQTHVSKWFIVFVTNNQTEGINFLLQNYPLNSYHQCYVTLNDIIIQLLPIHEMAIATVILLILSILVAGAIFILGRLRHDKPEYVSKD